MATIIAVLVNSTNPNTEALVRDLQAAARTLGLQLHVLHASSEGDFDTVFAPLVQLRAAALVIGTDAFFKAKANSLPLWRSATRYPPSIRSATSSRPAA
jgi:putative ABC transport system substrate-binding protein